MPRRRAISTGRDALGLQRLDLSSPCPRRRFPALVLSFGFGLGDALALPFEDHLALKTSQGSDNRKHQPACRCAGIGSQVQDAKVGTLGLYAVGDFEQPLTPENLTAFEGLVETAKTDPD
jgi:hypothetical protein